jgi:hypothetical protein
MGFATLCRKMLCMGTVPAGGLCMMGRGYRILILIMLCRFLVMIRRLQQMICGVVMMLSRRMSARHV